MTHAYTPAFDFDPKEPDMTDLELLEILERPVSNLEKALAIRVLLKASQPSALNIKPQVQRKPRSPNKPKPASPLTAQTIIVNGADHEAQP